MISSMSPLAARTLARTALLLTCAVGAAGCGPTCAQIADQRAQFLRRPPPAPSWHLAVAIPRPLIDRLLAEELAELPVVRVPLPSFGQTVTEPLTIRVRRCTLRPAPADTIGLLLELDVLYGAERAFSLTLEPLLRPALDARRGALEVGLRPDDLTAVKPRLDPQAAQRLGQVMHRRLPSAVRPFVPRAVLDAAAARAVTFLGEQLFRLLKTVALPRLGEIARLRLDLRGLPVAAMGISTQPDPAGALRLLVRTTLPVAHGLTLDQIVAGSGTARAFIPGATATELGNWGMVRGLLPGRVNSKGELHASGELELAFDWVHGPRPAKVHVWKLERHCLHGRLGATPTVELKAGELEIAARDMVLEKVEGPPLVRAAVWGRALWSRTYSFCRKLASQMQFTVAGRTLRLEVVGAALSGDTFTVDLQLRRVPASASAPVAARVPARGP
jgi:hypothetical protein